MQSIFDIEDKEEDLYAILNCVDTSSVIQKLIQFKYIMLYTVLTFLFEKPEQIKTEYKRLILLHHPDKKNQESSRHLFGKYEY